MKYQSKNQQKRTKVVSKKILLQKAQKKISVPKITNTYRSDAQHKIIRLRTLDGRVIEQVVKIRGTGEFGQQQRAARLPKQSDIDKIFNTALKAAGGTKKQRKTIKPPYLWPEERKA